MKFEEVLPALREGKTVKCTINGVVWTIPKDEFNRGLILSSEMILDDKWEVVKPKDYARMYREGDLIFVRRESELSLDDAYNEWIGDWVEIPEGTS